MYEGQFHATEEKLSFLERMEHYFLIFFSLDNFIQKPNICFAKVCYGNLLPTQSRENNELPRQKPRQLPSADANFEGWALLYTWLMLSFPKI